MFELGVRWVFWQIDLTLKAALIALLAAAVLRLLRIRDSNIRHRVWMATRTSFPRSVLGLRSSWIISLVAAKSRQFAPADRNSNDKPLTTKTCSGWSQSLPIGVMITGLPFTRKDGCLTSAFGPVTPLSR